jgi:hypothetical protein
VKFFPSAAFDAKLTLSLINNQLLWLGAWTIPRFRFAAKL